MDLEVRLPALLMSSTWVRLPLAVLIALTGFAIILEVSGADAASVMTTLLIGSWGSPTAIVETLVKAAPLCLCALCAAIPGRYGLINIGGEGQLLAGAIGASGVALLVGPLPMVPMLGLMAVGAMTVGAAWGILPGLIKAWTRSSETVTSLLLNYVAALLLLYLIHGPWRDPAGFGWAQSAAFPEWARLPVWPGTRVHLLVVLTPLLALVAGLAFRRTTLGPASRLIAASEITSRVVGLRPGWHFAMAFAAGGAIAGLAGLGEVAGIQGRLREGLSLGYGFSGFLVAWLCRNNFAIIPFGALALAGVVSAGDALQISSGLPFATVDILQGLLLLAVILGEAGRPPAVEVGSVREVGERA